jgi:hypothetical protein
VAEPPPARINSTERMALWGMKSAGWGRGARRPKRGGTAQSVTTCVTWGEAGVGRCRRKVGQEDGDDAGPQALTDSRKQRADGKG